MKKLHLGFFGWYLMSILSAIGAERQQPLLLDIGIIGLTSHDLISWDREKKTLRDPQAELNLRTIFDFNEGKSWRLGGDPKNSENPVVYTVVQHLLMVYDIENATLLSKGISPEASAKIARGATIAHYRKMVRVSFERLFGLAFPDHAIDNKCVTHEEHAAMRAAHHILPGKIKFLRGHGAAQEVAITDSHYAMTVLIPNELQQMTKGFDGKYEPEHLDFTIPHGPRAGSHQSLYEIDKNFVKTHTNFDFDSMLSELALHGSFKDVSFSEYIVSLYAKGLSKQSSPCS